MPLVYVTLFKGSSGRRKVDRVKPCSCSYIPLSSFSFSPGGTRWRVRRKDRQEVTSVMSAKAKVCQKRMLLPKEHPETFSSSAFSSSSYLSLLLLSISVFLSLFIFAIHLHEILISANNLALSFFIPPVQRTINQKMSYV